MRYVCGAEYLVPSGPPMPRILIHDIGRQLATSLPAIEATLLNTVRAGHFVLGRAVREFEAAFAAYCGVAHAVGVGNGTDALEIALRALDVAAGDRVLTVANAGGYANAAIRATGATPCYVDVDEATLQMSVDTFAKALALKPRAIILTHLFGKLVNFDALLPLAASANIPIIEDCAQAHGARRDAKRAGAFGAIGCFSFYPTKNLGALGDGGAVVTRDAALAEKIRALRQYGWQHKYHVNLAGGRNSRLDEIQAAVLLARLPSLDMENAKRRGIAAAYAREISHPDIHVPDRSGEHDVVHLMVVRCKQRDVLAAHLERQGIASDIHYPVPDHRQAAYFDSCISLPVTERLAAEILTIPCHPAMRDDEIESVIHACNHFPRHDN